MSWSGRRRAAAVRGDVDVDVDVAALRFAVGHGQRLEGRVDRRALHLQAHRPHEVEELLDDGVGHLGFVDDVADERRGLRVVAQLAAEQYRHHLDARQGILYMHTWRTR